METRQQILSQGWQARCVPANTDAPSARMPWIPAEVPGHVHMDLVRAGIIMDPFVELGEIGAQWVDQCDWIYKTSFSSPEASNGDVYLIFRGLDTVAEIDLNGERIGDTDNMFIPHEFKVNGKLNPLGEMNELRVTFRSATRVGTERHHAWDAAGNPTLPWNWGLWGDRAFVRKAQYMFGWDWGPVLKSCGIWRPVALQTVPVARMLDWKYEVEFVSKREAIVRLEVFVQRSTAAESVSLQLEAEIGGAGQATVSIPTGPGRLSVKVDLPIDNPIRWEPNGVAGPDGPHLYALDLAILGPEGLLDEKITNIGLRTVELLHDADPDGKGEGFKFRINGRDVFAKGANWIPADSFLSRLNNEADMEAVVDDNRVEHLLTMAAEAGYNMLRVWGGGLYESDHFYEECDRLGIMVWQDFPYACGWYPDTGIYADASRKEALDAVRRIRVHPSITLWCGNNENHQAWDDQWGGQLPPRFLGQNIYEKILPEIVAQENPTTPYWPGSPYGGENATSAEFGDRHNWNVWHGIGDWKHYVADFSRFCSEFGFCSSCGLSAWSHCLTPDNSDPYGDSVRWHDKTGKGYDRYLEMVAIHFPRPTSLEDLVYFTQINQAEALKFGVEHYRRLKGRCWGTLFWQINDCWPVQSWAVIDSALEPKAAWYASRRFYDTILLSFQQLENQVEIHLTNDLYEDLSGKITLVVSDFNGSVIGKDEANVTMAANSTGCVFTTRAPGEGELLNDRFMHAIFAPDDGDGPVENFLFFAEPKDWKLANPILSVDVRECSCNCPEGGCKSTAGGGDGCDCCCGDKKGRQSLTIGTGGCCGDKDECCGDGGQDEFQIVLKAERFAPYVWLRLTDNEGVHHGGISDNFFHLAPGQSRTVYIEKSEHFASMQAVKSGLEVRTL